MKRLLLLCLIFLSVPFVLAGSQVDFIAVVSEINEEDDGTIVLQMALNPDFILPVRVTEETELFDENDDELQIEELKEGLLLRIRGLFTSAGILADEVIVKEDESGFRITGTIQDIPDRQIVISGVTIDVAEDAEIKDDEGHLLEFADLEVGQRVRAKGDIVEGSFEAFEVKVRPFEARAPRIRFEGTVASIDGDEVKVTIEGVGEAVVIITADTRIKGHLAVGVFVRILGTINPDLTVNAKAISTRQRLRVAPDELEMRFEQTRRVEVILRDAFDEDVTLTIESANPDIASPSADSLTIEAGKITGAFEVTSGRVEGETVITVQMPADRGGETATVEVEVEDEKERREEDLEIDWRPDDIRMRPNSEKEVHLRLDQRAPTGGLRVELSLKEGPEGLVEFPDMVEIPEGERGTKVTIMSLGETGEVEIRAELPEDVGGDDDDLEVEIRGAPRPPVGEVEIERETELFPPADAPFPGAEGEVKIEFKVDDSEVEQEFELKVEDLGPNMQFQVRVSLGNGNGSVSIGTIITDEDGKAELEIEVDGLSFPGLPTGKNVGDICDVEVVQASINGPSTDEVVLQGTFCP